MNGVRSTWWAAAVCGAAILSVFQFWGNAVRGYINTGSLFYWWGFQWFNEGSETEHGPLVLGLSAWLLWRGLRAGGDGRPGRPAHTTGVRDETDERAARPYLAPLAALIGGLALHAVGFVAQQTRVSILGFLLCAWGVLRLGGGKRWGAAAAFPLAFMVFSIPINALDSIGFWLRVWVVEASGAIARGAGIAVLQSGTQLASPDGAYNYDVAAACSGVRSLTAMAALSLLAGYLNFRGWGRRVLVLLLCFPLVYVGNVVRILAIVFAAEAGGPKWGDVAHEVMGYGIFVIVLGGVLGAIALLRRFWPERDAEVCHVLRDKLDRAPGVGEGAAVERGGWGGRVCLVAGVVVAVAVAEMVFLRHVSRLPARGAAGVVLAEDGTQPVELPAFLGTEWIGRRAEVSAVEREILPQDTGYSRKNYVAVADPRQQVFVSVVLSGRDRTSIHRPELCLVGQGWTVRDAFVHRFAFPGRAGAAVPATVLRVQREVQTPRGKQIVPQLVAYWFVAADGVEASHARMFFRDAWNRVTRARADRWAYVLLQTDAADGEAQALARMQAVLNETLPAFQTAAEESAEE